MMLKKVLPPDLLADVVEAGGGEEALAICQREPIELMFLDLTMPERDGYAVLAELQRAGRVPPTFVVSADIQPGASDRVRDLGALAFLKKTPDRATIETALANAGLR